MRQFRRCDLDKIEVFWGKEGSGSNSDQMIPSPVTRFQNISWLKVEKRRRKLIAFQPTISVRIKC